jgi:hypothetical protein
VIGELFDAMFKGVGTVNINGVKYTGQKINIIHDDVFVDGVLQGSNIPDRRVIVTVEGDVTRLETHSGSVRVSGNCQSINTSSGDVRCGGIVESVSTYSGNVSSRFIEGSVKTYSGNIVSKQ